MKTNHYDKLRSLDYKQYKKAIERSEGVCLNLEKYLINNPEKSKIFSKIESSIVSTFLEFVEKEKINISKSKIVNKDITINNRTELL